MSDISSIFSQKLKGAEARVETLQRDHDLSRQSHAQLQAKLDRTLEALRIAGANVANARAEADAAGARAASLAGQRDDLRSAIEDARRGMEAVRREHGEVVTPCLFVCGTLSVWRDYT